jgi:tetratricopeptide (TPR) repeat protein
MLHALCSYQTSQNAVLPKFGEQAFRNRLENRDTRTSLLEQAAVMAAQVRWPAVLHSAQISRAQLDLARGRPRAALTRLAPLAEATDLDCTGATVPLTVLSQAHLELGDATKALKFAERALREAETMDNRLDAVGALRAKGMAQGQQGRRAEAAGPLDEALAMVRPMPYPYEEAKILREHGMLHLRQEEPERARERLSEPLVVFRRLAAREDAERIGRTLRELDRA